MEMSRTMTARTRKRGEKMENVEIRRAATKSNLRLWEVAEVLGMTDSTFSRKLRRELPSEEKSRILSAIYELAERKAGYEAGAKKGEEEQSDEGNANN